MEIHMYKDRVGVYPRECGGTSNYAATTDDYQGLSPRVRGNPQGQRMSACLTRSIPASAGEPPRPEDERLPYPVYPRECGGTV